MIEKYEIIYNGDDLAEATLDVLFLRSPGGTIKNIYLYTGANVTGEAVFNLTKNGVALWTADNRLIIAGAADQTSKADLSVATARGDRLYLDLEECPEAGVAAPITLILEIDDGVSAQISDEVLQDKVAAFLHQGSNVTINYDDNGNQITISSLDTTRTNEEIMDVIAALVQAGTNVTVAYDDANDHLTISSTAAAGVTAHSALSGLSADDHPQYFNQTRGDARYAQSSAVTTALDGKQNSLGFTPENAANKNQPNGYVGLDGTTKIPAAYLPSYVDDVLEYANLAAFPAAGETGKIYIALDTNLEYRWSGSTYIQLVSSPGSTDAVAEGATNKYFTESRVLASAMVGLAVGVAQAIANGDSLKTMLQNLQAQISANVTAIAGKLTANAAISPGTATKVTFDANGLITASGATTASDIGLGNVTNNAQLTRGANDFSTFTEKTAIAADDLILIEDSAASGVKKRVKKSNLLAGLGGATSNGFSFFSPDAPYLVPSAYDDEFAGSSLDSKWTFRRASSNSGTDEVFNFTKTPSILQLNIPVGSTSFGYRMISQAISMASDWAFVAKIDAGVFASGANAIGLFVGDGATGANAAGFGLQFNGTGLDTSILKRAINGTAVTSSNVNTALRLSFIYMKLRRDSAGDNFYVSYSYDGINFSAETALWATTKPAMSEVGIFWSPNVAPGAAYVDWFRKVDASGQTGRLITI